MAGDYYRYLAEFMSVSCGHHDNARTFYQKALDLANSGSDDPNDRDCKVPTTHPIRLGLALNFSVCYYEILNQTDQAIALAQKTFDDALEDMDYLTEQAYKDSVMILQLLRDNLILWGN
jgi:14-3-3 protein epsilon